MKTTPQKNTQIKRIFDKLSKNLTANNCLRYQRVSNIALDMGYWN